jgi:hypothetical protein
VRTWRLWEIDHGDKPETTEDKLGEKDVAELEGGSVLENLKTNGEEELADSKEERETTEESTTELWQSSL